MADNSPAPKRRGLFVALGLVIVLVVAGYFVWRTIWPRESTDDAQVTGHVSPIAARISGEVMGVHITENQLVHEGDVLVEIDPHDFQIALAKAEADLSAAQAAAKAAETGVPLTSTTATGQLTSAQAGTSQAEAGVETAARAADAERAKQASAEARLEEAAANATKASQDLERLRPLVAKDEIPKQQFDAAVAAERAAKASVSAANASVLEAKANVAAADARKLQANSALNQASAETKAATTVPQQVALSTARAEGAQAQVQQAAAAVDQAKLNLERATIKAPATGIVSRKNVEVGQIIQAGQPLFSLTSLAEVWITANFKETQLTKMHQGQRAEIEVDAYKSHPFNGHVDSIAAATGATFSLLPADNATGNFVKVVQRVPVKIVLDTQGDTEHVLRPGMSVGATVYLK